MTGGEQEQRSKTTASGAGVGRAAGKVILLGEHAVVYGVPAIAASIERGVTAHAAEARQAALSVNGAEVPEGHELRRSLRAVLARLGAPEMRVDLQLELPAGCGLGASAAMGVATARAVLAALGQEADDPRVLDATDGWERVFHGNPSGVDAAAALGNGCLQFTRGDVPRPLRPGLPLWLAVAVAGPPASTREMVESVAQLKARRPAVVDKTLDGIRSLVRNAVLCIEAGDRTGLGSLMNYNHMLLSGLMLSTESIERACNTARSAGALGAKLTGAGGGGCVVALVGEDATPVLEAWKREGFSCFATGVAGGRAAASDARGVTP
jgi:mevalonate kinase